MTAWEYRKEMIELVALHIIVSWYWESGPMKASCGCARQGLMSEVAC